MWNKLKDIDHFIRTALFAVAVAGLGYGGWLVYATYNAADISENALNKATASLQEKEQLLADSQQQIAKRDTAIRQLDQRVTTQAQMLQEKDAQIEVKDAQIKDQALEIERKDTALRLLKVDQRLVHVIVREVTTDDRTGQKVSQVEFIEVNQQGDPIAEPQTLQLVGDEVRIDCWVVNFEDKYIEQADVERGTALVFFKRIYGNVEGPMKGHNLDAVGARPQIYSTGGRMTDFQERIWDDFWTFASDAEKADAMGIRAATGKSVFFPAVEGKLYKVTLRASDGLSVEPAIDAPNES
jgi:hypothetical protein